MPSVVSLYAGEPGTASSEFAALPPDLARNRVLTRREAAAYTGLSASTLERLAAMNAGPRFVKLSDRRIGYRVADLDTYVEARFAGPQSAA